MFVRNLMPGFDARISVQKLVRGVEQTEILQPQLSSALYLHVLYLLNFCLSQSKSARRKSTYLALNNKDYLLLYVIKLCKAFSKEKKKERN